MKIDIDKNKYSADEGSNEKTNADKAVKCFDFSRISSKKNASNRKMNVKYEIGLRGISKNKDGMRNEEGTKEDIKNHANNNKINHSKDHDMNHARNPNYGRNINYGRRNNNASNNTEEIETSNNCETRGITNNIRKNNNIEKRNSLERNNSNNDGYNYRKNNNLEGDNSNLNYKSDFKRKGNFDRDISNSHDFARNDNFVEKDSGQNISNSKNNENSSGCKNSKYNLNTDEFKEIHQKMDSLNIKNESSIYVPPHLKMLNKKEVFIPQNFLQNKKINTNYKYYSRYKDYCEEESYEEELYDESEYYVSYPRSTNSTLDLTKVVCNTSINPVLSFSELKLPANLYERLKSLKPTSVQSYAIPAILMNRDIICRAPTGVGKTISFLVPIILKLKYRKKPCLRVLVISPTRELAAQIQNELDKLISLKGKKNEEMNILDNSYLKGISLYGGKDVYAAKANIASGCDILIATPGRLCEFIEKRYLTLKNVKFFVLDEADRMLEMGFEREMKYIRANLNNPLKYMFSATFDIRVRREAELKLSKNKISIEYENETLKNIIQEFIYEDRAKFDIITEIIKKNEKDRILIFVEKRITCGLLEKYLSKSFDCVSLHGDKSQIEREAILHKFRTGICNILVATSVASRGLDIPLINLVVNYDLPRDIKDYIHRIGRSGRCGKMGWSISIYNPKVDQDLKNNLVNVLVESGNQIPYFLKR